MVRAIPYYKYDVSGNTWCGRVSMCLPFLKIIMILLFCPVPGELLKCTGLSVSYPISALVLLVSSVYPMKNGSSQMVVLIKSMLCIGFILIVLSVYVVSFFFPSCCCFHIVRILNLIQTKLKTKRCLINTTTNSESEPLFTIIRGTT